MNFIVVEDNASHKELIEKMIHKYMMKNKIEYEVLAFTKNSKELEDHILHSDKNDIYILDYELPNATAIDVCRIIRSRTCTAPIIVVTAHGDKEFYTYRQRLQILDFIDKAELNEDRFFPAIADAVNMFYESKEFFRISCREVDYNIEKCKIMYIYREKQSRKAILVTEKNHYDFNLTLREFKNILDDRFAYTNKSCIVNLQRVEAFIWKDSKMILDTKEELYYLSKTHKKEILAHAMVRDNTTLRK